jgi:hypothetical protein
MPPTKSHGKADDLRELVAKCAADLVPNGLESMAEAMKSVLTATEYEDDTLFRSSINAALEQYRDIVDRDIDEFIGLSGGVRDVWTKVKKDLTGCPAEDLDDVGGPLESLFERALAVLLRMRDGPVRSLQEHEYEVKNADRLDAEIEEISRLKTNVMAVWPWTSRKLPPVNRKMVAESREAIAQGKGMSMEEAIRSLGGDATPTE